MDGHKARSFWTCSYQVIPYAMFQFDFNLQSGRMRGKTQSDHGKLTSLQRKFLIPLLVPLGCFNADLRACVWCLSNRSSYQAKRIHQTYLALHTQFHGGFVWFGILSTPSPFTGCFPFSTHQSPGEYVKAVSSYAAVTDLWHCPSHVGLAEDEHRPSLRSSGSFQVLGRLGGPKKAW